MKQNKKYSAARKVEVYFIFTRLEISLMRQVAASVNFHYYRKYVTK